MKRKYQIVEAGDDWKIVDEDLRDVFYGSFTECCGKLARLVKEEIEMGKEQAKL